MRVEAGEHAADGVFHQHFVAHRFDVVAFHRVEDVHEGFERLKGNIVAGVFLVERGQGEIEVGGGIGGRGGGLGVNQSGENGRKEREVAEFHE